MKIDRIKYGKSFQVGLSVWERIDMEASVEHSESMNTCFDELRKEIDYTHRLLNPHLYPKGNEAIILSSPYETTNVYSPPPVVNLEQEKIEIAIDNCTSKDELVLLQNDAIKNNLVPQYLKKQKELSI
jgi:hypothetical protein